MVLSDYQSLFRALPTPFMVLDKNLRFVEMNDAYLAVTRRSRDELLGRYVFEAFPETGERLTTFKAAFEQAIAGTPNTLVNQPFSIPRPSHEGGGFREVYWNCSHMPLFGDGGQVVGMVQHANDVTKEFEAAKLNRVMAAELDHRVRNMLAVVATIARQTGRRSTTIEQFLRSFEDRVSAMARTQALLASENWGGATLRALLDSELEPFKEHGWHNIVLSGPDLRLTLSESQTLSIAFHELATNAAKYGAFSVDHGALSVTWLLTGTRGYTIEWRESGLEGIAASDSRGFGSTIIDTVTPTQLGGEVRREITPTGLVCTIAVHAPPATEHGR